MWQLGSGVFLGWSLGANDASNVFGTAVASQMVRFWTAAILCSIFAMAGALLQGAEGMHTYHDALIMARGVSLPKERFSILNVTRHVLLALGVEPPEDMD